MWRSVQNLCNPHKTFLTTFRNLTATEVSTALRPFYFSVHPDLFEQYPTERATNESSLQQLSSTLANIQASRPIRPINLQFYIKDKTQPKVSFRVIRIYIQERNIRSAIITILRSSGLSTDYVDRIIKSSEPESESAYYKIKFKNKSDIDFTKINKNHPIYAHIVLKKKIREAQEALKLKNWLKNNFKDALEKSQKGEAYREEIQRLRDTITKDLGLREIRWECGWNDTHFRGCLLSFKSLVEQHPEVMYVLRGRTLVFSFFTGVSLDGHIMLYSGEVRHNWLDFLKNIRKYDMSLRRIPAFEKSLSHVLRDIKVGRRKFMPKIIAGTYEENLRQITTALSDYRGLKPFPKEWPDSLKDYEIVVETEAGPLMVSPTGQFIVPSTLPGALLVNFITTNLEEAHNKNREYQSDKHLERSLIDICIAEFQLAALQKEDNVTPDLMIKCCKNLLENKYEIAQFIKGNRLNISTYYSVLSDGVICIPWNYEL
ncbi:hypothetical protein NQ314_000998 [Rhamnusium bicolor]|uniref:T-cell activation inhibitor, mitochondrial n=1 Tax=Rhamnusium bicolor TaxID=1586634 RepID=A0AAV8ZUV8_9CUCU|nr:hypothetical protein NQ314_000998 [Rhamnusium bicolor]